MENSSPLIPAGSSCGGLVITGDPFTGVSLTYQSCLTGTFGICRLDLFSISLAQIPGCHHLRVLAHPVEQTAIAVDCSETPRPATGGHFSFDPYGKVPTCDFCAVPVESKTWGAVKALYR